MTERAKITVHVDPDLEPIIPRFFEIRRTDIGAILKAVDTGDFETAGRLGHSMKGAGAGYGFDAVTEMGRVIESAAKAADGGAIRQEVEALADYLDRVEVVYDG